MVNLLPAVLIGGPPHAGKSVLTYSLTQALRKRQIAHFVIRACPDGEGDWSQEIDQTLVRRIRVKGQWTSAFVEYICAMLERRHFPLLVDIGGRLETWQTVILRHCTHSLLLLRRDDEIAAHSWRSLVVSHSLLPLAELSSELEGVSLIEAEWPVIKGTLTGLDRTGLARGSLFDLLVERIASLFTSYSGDELRNIHLQTAPARVLDLDAALREHAGETERWEPAMLVPFLATVPGDVPLALYGRGPNWLYAALALHSGAQPFFQFDPRLGWITPPPLSLGTTPTPEIDIKIRESEHYTVLSVHPLNDYIEYEQIVHLSFPPLSSERGLILSGKLPLCLVTAMARLYNDQGLPWTACYSPQNGGAIVIASRTAAHPLGQHLPTESYETHT